MWWWYKRRGTQITFLKGGSFQSQVYHTTPLIRIKFSVHWCHHMPADCTALHRRRELIRQHASYSSNTGAQTGKAWKFKQLGCWIFHSFFDIFPLLTDILVALQQGYLFIKYSNGVMMKYFELQRNIRREMRHHCKVTRTQINPIQRVGCNQSMLSSYLAAANNMKSSTF